MNKTIFDKKMANSIHLKETTEGVAEKSINSNLRDYQILGNTVQDGEPAIDNPVEVVSVGDKSGNLIHPLDTTSSLEVYAGNEATISVDEENQKITITDGSSKWGLAAIPYAFVKGKTYTFSAKIEEMNSTTGVRIAAAGYLFDSGEILYSKYGKTVGETLSITFTVEKNVRAAAIDNPTGGAVRLYPMGANEENASATFSEISLIEGTPEKPYAINMHVSGKNLVDINEFQLKNPKGYYYMPKVTVDGSTLIVSASQPNAIQPCYLHCKVPVGEKITISATNIYCNDSANISNTQIRYKFTDSYNDILGGGSSGATVFYNLYYGQNNIAKKVTTTATHQYLVIIIQIQNENGAITIDDLQVEIGQQTSYEPYIGYQKTLYLTEPIRKIGEYQDYIDFRNCCVIRNCAFQKFNSAQDWMLGNSNSVGNIMYYKLSKNRLGVVDGKVNALLNNCKAVSSSVMTPPTYLAPMSVVYGGANNYMYIFVGNEIAMTIAEWKAWLDNNDMHIVYALSSSITEDIELPRLPQYKGQTIYQIATNIPSEFVGTYKYRL